MKVAIYSGTIPSTTFIERLIEGLAEKEIEIIIHGSKTNTVHYNLKNIKVIGFSGSLSKIWILLKYLIMFLATKPRRLNRLLKCYSKKEQSKSFFNWFIRSAPIVWEKPDIFHLQWAKGIEEWIFLKDLGIAIVLSLRGIHINFSPVFDNKLADTYSRLFPKVNRFHGVSEAICLEAKKYNAGFDKCCVIYSGLNLDQFTFTQKKIKDDKLKIISVGRPHYLKGYNIAIDAIKNLQESGLTFKYRIIGGKDEELIYQVVDLGLEREVQLEESVQFEVVKSAIINSDILLLPSCMEGIPNVVLEAMALGTIVISTVCGGISEVIKDGYNGFLVPIRNPLAISNKILLVKELSNEELNRIRKNARITIETQHNHQKMVNEMITLYMSLK